MSDVWLITRSLTDEIASNLTLEEAMAYDNGMTAEDTYKTERFSESIKIKTELNLLGIECKFRRSRDLVSPGYVRCLTDLPKLAIDGFHAYDYLNNHMNNLYALKELGVKIVNDPDIHYICGDKWKYQKIMENHNIPTIKSISLPLPITDKSIEIMESSINYPVVVKPTTGALSRGVEKCYTADDVWQACLKIYKLPFKPKNVIIQKWIDHSIKGTLRTHMINGNIVSCSQRHPKTKTDFFYSNNRETRNKAPYEITPKLIDLCKSIHLAMNNIDMCAMDILHDGENYLVCDINSPGTFTGVDANIGKLFAQHLASKI